MSDEERLKKILEIKDRAISIYDKVTFEYEKNGDFSAILKLKETFGMLDELVNSYIKDSKNMFLIKSKERLIIKNEETRSIKTNITWKYDKPEEISIIHDGFIPSDGYIKVFENYNINGLNVLVKNDVPQYVFDQYDKFDCKYCSIGGTKYFAPGIFLIEENDILGVGIDKTKKRSYFKLTSFLIICFLLL